MVIPPILDNKDVSEGAVFVPAAMIREARRQKQIPSVDVPSVCLLDPDGDIVRRLRADGRARRFEPWPCYHSELYTFHVGEQLVGVVGCAVGGPFAVLVAEQMFACGCRLLISMTSAGQILPTPGPPPYFVVIDRALRDEGTSYHYAASSEFLEADMLLVDAARTALGKLRLRAYVGASWTTDAPFRETAKAIEAARHKGILAVEMEAASLYAFAKARGAAVLCLAHVTNTMGQVEGDFEKGEADGTAAALKVLDAIIAPLVQLTAAP
ncbi:MAG: uridine phosphorylase [Rhodospirillales bacterium 20-64-7]|nr:MAG: uridine phosphorylase [Rhodospirillales bacterium 20-64-7]